MRAPHTPVSSIIGTNQKVTPEQIAKIRQLDDFDLMMLISEIHDHGWLVAKKTLSLMPERK